MKLYIRIFGRFSWLLFAFLLHWGSLIAPTAAEGAPFAEYKVKAAFLLKFADFVDWPSSVIGNASDPIRVGVVGFDPFVDLLPEDISPADEGGDFFFKVTRLLPDDESITDFNILFFSSASQASFAAIREKIASLPILTVGDGEAFIMQGGMIAFSLENNRVHFAANLKSFRRAHLHISAQLLELAEKVIK